jgi:3-oxoadipate enol-lactonase
MPQASVNGIRLNYEVHGSGEPLLLIQGWGTDLRAWIFQVPAFRKHFQVVTFDNRGVGKSEKPAGPYSMKMMAADAVALMDHLHIPAAHVLGLSMGGMIAQEVALNYPDRVMKLVLGCTFSCQKDGSGETEEYTKATGKDSRATKLALASLANNSPVGRLFVALWMTLNSRSWAEGFESQGAAIRGHDTSERLHTIASPTLVICGTRDRVIRPSSSEFLASRIPNARLVMIENGSHSMSAENRREFNRAVLDFLGDLHER